ncbi:hypothetical protein SAY87_015823 [Trapa incisa]|uniref:DNA-3-methyladenine glycosylase I n=1 Tax=Trapa incisa TaxID=236973 RepID=A0AAN7QUY5_9MYRT|nr:hypothetical protein SAY87_015823 [Trapa incisa]
MSTDKASSPLSLRRSFLTGNKPRSGERSPADDSSKASSSRLFDLSNHLKKIYPIRIHRTISASSLSLSSVSLSLSQNSNDSSTTDYSTISPPLDRKISLALRLIAPLRPALERREAGPGSIAGDDGEPRRCNWITKTSDKAYVSFHDEQWGVPVYDDRELFELLAMSGMLMDYNWTEILKRKSLFREAFAGFEASAVAKMGEKEMADIASDKEVMLAECRVRCIVDNAKCILKVVRECGSFSNYVWSYVNHKPIVNRYRHPRHIPLRTPKAEAMSKDMQKRGFRLVGPVIVCSFMQAAGLTIDHLVDCYRHGECVSLAERPWRHI